MHLVTICHAVADSFVVNALSTNGSLGKAYTKGADVSPTEFKVDADANTLTPPTDTDEVQYLVKFKKNVKSGAKITSTIDAKTKDIEKYRKSLSQFNSMVEKNDANFQSELDRQTYYADFLADMDKAGIDISDAIISQDMQAVSDGISDGIESIQSATVYDFSKLNETTQSQIRNYYSGLVSTANTEMQSAKATLSTSNAEFASYVNMWMQNSSGSYLAMTGNDEMQSALSSIVSGLNWGDILQGDDFSGLSGEELESAIEWLFIY